MYTKTTYISDKGKAGESRSRKAKGAKWVLYPYVSQLPKGRVLMTIID